MPRIKYILLIMAMVIASGCEISREAANHTPTLNKLNTFPYGSWVDVKYQQHDDSLSYSTLSGELLAFQDHNLIIMDSSDLYSIHESKVYNAKLYVYKNTPGPFAALTVMFIIPNVIAAITTGYPEFMFLAIPVFVSGTIFTIAEATRPGKNSRLIYPESNRLEEFAKYARFPQGVPEGFKVED